MFFRFAVQVSVFGNGDSFGTSFRTAFGLFLVSSLAFVLLEELANCFLLLSIR